MMKKLLIIAVSVMILPQFAQANDHYGFCLAHIDGGGLVVSTAFATPDDLYRFSSPDTFVENRFRSYVKANFPSNQNIALCNIFFNNPQKAEDKREEIIGDYRHRDKNVHLVDWSYHEN